MQEGSGTAQSFAAFFAVVLQPEKPELDMSSPPTLTQHVILPSSLLLLPFLIKGGSPGLCRFPRLGAKSSRGRLLCCVF